MSYLHDIAGQLVAEDTVSDRSAVAPTGTFVLVPAAC